MPELPEVQGLTVFLNERLVGHGFASLKSVAVAALKTFDPPLSELEGRTVARVARYGKFIDIGTTDLHFVFHLAKAGWLRWHDQLPKTPIKPSGRMPLALRVRFDDDSGFDLTEAGMKKRLAVYVTRNPEEVPGIARLGPDPTAEDFTLADFADSLRGRRAQLKGVLRDQSIFAGIGNAYSDEILHAARMSPYLIAAKLNDAQIAGLFSAMRSVLDQAIAEAAGRPPAELKDAKRGGMRVHGRTGKPCPVCGDTVREVIFVDSTFQYCPTCQTGGKPLADRVLSRLVK